MASKVLISIVNHFNYEQIVENLAPTDFGSEVQLVIIDNGYGQTEMKRFCEAKSYLYICDKRIRGYGANHNRVFNQYGGDYYYFLVMNPDVRIETVNWTRILNMRESRDEDLMGVRVLEGANMEVEGNHNRRYPALLDPVVSLLFSRKLYIKSAMSSESTDWIGGAFMFFKSESYREVNGFDERFFMYYEDIDICRRINSNGGVVHYAGNVAIYHGAQRNSRNLISISFRWYLSSMIKYFLKYPTLRLITWS